MEIKLITEKERLTWVKMSREGGKISLKESPIYPLHLGGVWMVGVKGYIGPKFNFFVL